MLVLDSHVHCGRGLPFEVLQPRWEKSGIKGGVLFSPAEEIYERHNHSFFDSAAFQDSRQKVHRYLESLRGDLIHIYWFVWNDFQFPGDKFSGVKWHRHSNEPRYDYDSEKCLAFVEHICLRKMPVILEEEFENTFRLVEMIGGRTPVIIPHMGGLNGGYHRLQKAGLFEEPSIYADTALASSREISDFAGLYGTDRLLFGSDFPFGEPSRERFKVEKLFEGEELEQLFSGNLQRLLKEVKPPPPEPS